MMIWKGFANKQFVASFEIPAQHSPGRSEENQKKTSVRIAGVSAETQTKCLLNTSQKMLSL